MVVEKRSISRTNQSEEEQENQFQFNTARGATVAEKTAATETIRQHEIVQSEKIGRTTNGVFEGFATGDAQKMASGAKMQIGYDYNAARGVGFP